MRSLFIGEWQNQQQNENAEMNDSKLLYLFLKKQNSALLFLTTSITWRISVRINAD